MRRILVLRGGALGDFIVTLPALALLRERWPAARIELAGNPTAAQLALARGVLDAVHSQHEARWSALFTAAPLEAGFAGWLGQFDLVINYWPDPEETLRRHFPVRSGQQFISAPALPTRAPAAAHYSAALAELGLECHTHLFRLAPLPGRRGADSDRAASTHPHVQYIAAHPGSGSPRKNWPWDDWRRLLPRLPGPVSLILGEAELERLPPRPAFEGPGECRIRELRHRSLEELIDHFARCRLFLGHDSGISHLAAACGVRCVLLFGPTDPVVWAPPSPHVQVLRCVPDLASLPVDSVLRAAEAALADRT